ncbi:hypothetical protein BDK88_3937 [Natrinema hispanicum]|uniref:Uncharacterized protein n=1 Tax=Natrinema hispanicum TaxID=392421 RepID=A0A482Y886_9EURY|nr:hypothetical protein [Natrinema hispanicum]RZV06386.1 hypothetical protein BDK88_3937 [Natrinema hispanicum]
MTGNSTQTTYNGDVTINGSERPPIELHDPADVFVTTAGVGGDLEVRNAEYVFTHQSVDSGVSVADAETTIRGDLEDGYVERTDGDIRITDTEDVFVATDAVDGEFSAPGAENVYTDAVSTAVTPTEYDVSTVGWQQSGHASDPSTGGYAVGMDHEIELEGVRTDIELYLVGHGHEVSVDGRSAEVSVHFLGYDNTVNVGPHLATNVVSDTGFDNEIDAEPYPAADLIEMSRDEAYANAGFGRRKVTFQVPADDEDWCSNCGREADAIIERHQMEAFFLFRIPVWTYEQSTNPAQECEHCSPNVVHAELSPEERRRVFE